MSEYKMPGNACRDTAQRESEYNHLIHIDPHQGCSFLIFGDRTHRFSNFGSLDNSDKG